MEYTPINQPVIEQVSLTFKALSDPTRIRILHLLFNHECSVTEIAETLDMQQSTISHQLAYLKQLRLLKSRREKNKYYYTIDDYHVMNLLEQTINHAKHTNGGI